MERFRGVKLSVMNFKCFGSEPQGFDEIQRLNLIIGRNNTGKSALLDIVKYATKLYDLSLFSHKYSEESIVRLSVPLSDDLITRCVPSGTSGGGIPGDHREHCREWIGRSMSIDLGNRSGDYSLDVEYVQQADKYVSQMAVQLPNPFDGKYFAHISAERDIAPEVESNELELQADGSGATNIIQQFINDEQFPSELIEVELRDDLNLIMGPDANFSRITVQRISGKKWAIFLDESPKGRISLANSGSGLKTVFLVLINMLVLCRLHDTEPSNFIFAFEELENNLHPGLQRRLLNYVQKKLVSMNAIAFVTTHSPAVIDMFSRADDAQILHVAHDRSVARVQRVSGATGGHRVLDDLDVKASDLLQANGIVWVEGISDVIYLRRWIDLYCASVSLPVPVEGSEYAFMEYGGRCLKHFDFSASDSDDLALEDAKWLLPALAFSRNTYVVMDSDKRDDTSMINATKLETISKARESWVTIGREIENYISPEIASEIFGNQLEQYSSASETYAANKPGRLDKKKTARDAVSMMTQENWDNYDLAAQVKALVDAISGWNPKYGGS